MPNHLNQTSDPTLHGRLREDLRARIRRGEYPGGSQIPTERELCRAFGVSTITVRQAVGDLVGEGLLSRHAGKGTFVQLSPPRRLGLVIADENVGQGFSFFSEVLRGVKALVQGERTLLVYSENETGYLSPGNVGGVILKNPRREDIRFSLLDEREIPYVVIGNPETPSAAYIDNDNEAIGEKMAETILAGGAKCPAFVSGPRGLTVCAHREQGIRRGLARSGFSGALRVGHGGDFVRQEGLRVATALIHEGADALLCCDDQLALGALDAARRLGLLVPQQVQIIGVNDSGEMAHSDPPLSTFDIQASVLGEGAASLLLALMEGQPAKPILVPGLFIERSSTKRIPL